MSQPTTDEITSLRKEVEVLRQQLQIWKRTKGAVDPGILETVITNIGTGFVVSDINGDIIYHNDASLRIHDFRYENEEIHRLDEYRKVFKLEYPEGGEVPFEKWPLPLAIKGDYFRDYVLRLVCRDVY